MKRVNRFSRCSVLAALLLVAPAAAAQVNVNSSPNVVGSGARALGMGGAFVAVADDATAASWNPAGLVQLERPEVSAVYQWQFSREDFSPGQRFDPYGADTLDIDSLNYLSAVYPVRRTLAGRNFVLSLNYQRKYDFNRSLDFAYRVLQPVGGFTFQSYGDVDFHQTGQLAALTPALGFELTDRLALGVAINIYNESLLPSNEWKKVTKTGYWTTFGSTITYGRLIQEERWENFEGVNYTFGLLWKPTPRLSLGAVYHTAFAADVDYTLVRNSIVPPNAGVTRQSRRMEFPSAWGVGAAYRFPGDRLTVSLDVTRRKWDRFVETRRGFLFGEPRRTSPITGLSKWRSPHDPTWTVRVGAEYVFFNPKQPLRNYLPSVRIGAMYDPEPSGGRQVNFLGLGPVTGEPDEFWGITAGFGVLIRNRVNIDLAYQYRWANDVRKDTIAMWDVDADVEQHALFLSTVIYF